MLSSRRFLLSILGLILLALVGMTLLQVFPGRSTALDMASRVTPEPELGVEPAEERSLREEPPRMVQEGESSLPEEPSPAGEVEARPLVIGASAVVESQFGSTREIIRSGAYNPGGVVLGPEREGELSDLLRSLEADYKSLMTDLRAARDAEIERRIAEGNYVHLPRDGPARFRPGPGKIGHVRTDPVLGRIAVGFAPSEAPEVAGAFAKRAAFLEEGHQIIKAFFH